MSRTLPVWEVRPTYERWDRTDGNVERRCPQRVRVGTVFYGRKMRRFVAGPAWSRNPRLPALARRRKAPPAFSAKRPPQRVPWPPGCEDLQPESQGLSLVAFFLP